jgi:hypothetical protein
MDSAKSHKVKPRRVAASPYASECKAIETISPDGVAGKPNGWYLAPGEGDGVHIGESE